MTIFGIFFWHLNPLWTLFTSGKFFITFVAIFTGYDKKHCTFLTICDGGVFQRNENQYCVMKIITVLYQTSESNSDWWMWKIETVVEEKDQKLVICCPNFTKSKLGQWEDNGHQNCFFVCAFNFSFPIFLRQSTVLHSSHLVLQLLIH